MQIDHQQSPTPGCTHPLSKHARSHAQDTKNQDPGQDDLSTAPLEAGALPEIVQSADQYLSHSAVSLRLICAMIFSVQQLKKGFHNLPVKMYAPGFLQVRSHLILIDRLAVRTV